MSDEHSDGGEGIMCTLCTKAFKSRKELFHHMSSATHRRQSVRCPWCLKKNVFTRVNDLSRHCDAVHFREYSLMPDGFLSIKNCFYLAVYPKDYATMTRVEKYDSALAIEARRVLMNHLENIEAEDEERSTIKDGWKAGLRIAEQIERKEGESKQVKAASVKTQKRKKNAKDNVIPQKKTKETQKDTKDIYDKMFKNEPIKIGIPKIENATPEISDTEDSGPEKKARVIQTRLDKDGIRRLMVVEREDGKVKNERLVGKPHKTEVNVKTPKIVTKKVEEGIGGDVEGQDMTLGKEKDLRFVDRMVFGTETDEKIKDEGRNVGGVYDEKAEGKVIEVMDVKETGKSDAKGIRKTRKGAGIKEAVELDVGVANEEGKVKETEIMVMKEKREDKVAERGGKEEKEKEIANAETLVDKQVKKVKDEVAKADVGEVNVERKDKEAASNEEGGLEKKGEIKEKRKIQFEEYKMKVECAKRTERVYDVSGGERILNEKGDAVKVTRNDDGIWQRVQDESSNIDINNNTVKTQEESTSDERGCVKGNDPSDDANHVETAIRILARGAMPLCPPARRQWGPDTLEEVNLGDGQVIQWPPRGWLNMTPDKRLMTVEMMAMTIEAFLYTAVAPEMSRCYLLDKYKYLMLPGALVHRKEKAEDTITRVRFQNYKFLKEVAAGKKLSFGEVEHLRALEFVCINQHLTLDPSRLTTPLQLQEGPSYLQD